jgi:hypothetical protein
LIVALALVYGWLIGGPPYYAAAAVGALSWAVSYGWNSYLSLRASIVGLNLIIWGIAFFALAAVISLAKAGLWARWLRRKETQTS